ncbi:MAG: hypothetical protein GON13_01785 [Nanoarchaeota archaeon]|nr:hypothetical protein [Nanoarchaeota archaeon]
MNLEKIVKRYDIIYSNENKWAANFIKENFEDTINELNPPTLKIITRAEQFRYAIKKCKKEDSISGLRYLMALGWYNRKKREISISSSYIKKYKKMSGSTSIHEIAHDIHFQKGASKIQTNGTILNEFLNGVINEGWATWFATQRYPQMLKLKPYMDKPVRVKNEMLPMPYVVMIMGVNMYRIGLKLVNNIHNTQGINGVKKILYHPEELHSDLVNDLTENLQVSKMSINGKKLDELEFKDLNLRDVLNPKKTRYINHYARKINNYLVEKSKGFET